MPAHRVQQLTIALTYVLAPCETPSGHHCFRADRGWNLGGLCVPLRELLPRWGVSFLVIQPEIRSASAYLQVLGSPS